MGGAFLKFRLLLWKNFLIQKRKPIATLFELGLPTLFALILMVLRLQVKSEPHPNVTEWEPCPYTYLEPRLYPLVLAYAPQNEATDRIMTRAASKLHLRKGKKYLILFCV